MYTAKLKEIMGDISLFYNIFEFPMSNGINYKTQFFKENLTFDEFCKYFHSKSPDAYAFYQNVEQQVKSFKEAFSEFVAQDDFLNKWNSMSEKEKKFLVYYDEDSYIILRGKLQKNEIVAVDWSHLIKESKPEWDKNFSKKLGLPSEFDSPPLNRLQALKQKKSLIENGYDEKKVTEIFQSLEINKDLLAKNLLVLVAEKHNNLEELCNKIETSIPYYINYQLAFINEQEKRLSSSTTKPKM